MTTPQRHNHTGPGDGGQAFVGTRLFQDASTNQSVGTSGEETLVLDSVSYDTMDGGDVSNDEVTVPRDGLYFVKVRATFDGPGDGVELNVRAKVNGNILVAGGTDTGKAHSSPDSLQAETADIRQLSEGDTIEPFVEHSGGSSISLGGTEEDNALTVVLVAH